MTENFVKVNKCMIAFMVIATSLVVPAIIQTDSSSASADPSMNLKPDGPNIRDPRFGGDPTTRIDMHMRDSQGSRIIFERTTDPRFGGNPTKRIDMPMRDAVGNTIIKNADGTTSLNTVMPSEVPQVDAGYGEREVGSGHFIFK